ncbi:hypothetical protein [Chamaesiphon minutus]|uniref:hypothetical protein n=1 Tax=Chamaesiphon minutus TaxID=1173032 RepID=UPI0012FC80F5|nr:hypothetical protein [Chamaesiphon minutus]
MADITDMADIKKTINSRNTSKKYVNRFNVGDRCRMIKLSSTNDDREPETNRGRDLGVDDKTDFNRPPIIHSRTSIVHSRFIVHLSSTNRTFTG